MPSSTMLPRVAFLFNHKCSFISGVALHMHSDGVAVKSKLISYNYGGNSSHHTTYFQLRLECMPSVETHDLHSSAITFHCIYP